MKNKKLYITLSVLLSVIICIALAGFKYQQKREEDYLLLLTELKKAGDEAISNESWIIAEKYFQKALIWANRIKISSKKEPIVKDINEILNTYEMEKVELGFVPLDGEWVVRESFMEIYKQHRAIEDEAKETLINAVTDLNNKQYEEASFKIYQILDDLQKYPWLNSRISEDNVYTMAVSIPEGFTTPLHHSAKHENIKIAENLLELGASLNIYDTSGNLPIYYCYQNNNLDLIELFYKHGAGVDGTFNQVHPLYYAINSENLELVHLLIKYGADLDRTYNGEYPVILATKKSNASLLEVLLESGADPNVENSYKLTALAYALFEDDTDSFNLLLSFGANKEKIHSILLSSIDRQDIKNTKLYRIAEELALEKQQEILKSVTRLGVKTRRGLIYISEYAMKRLQEMSYKAEGLCYKNSQASTNRHESLESAAASLNVLAKFLGRGSTRYSDFYKLYGKISNYALNQGCRVKLRVKRGIAKFVIIDSQGTLIENPRLTDASPFIFDEFNYYIMRIFPRVPGVIDTMSFKYFSEILKQKIAQNA